MKTEHKTGTFVMGRCTVIVNKNGEHWQLAVHCLSAQPSYKEVIQARDKYIPNDVVMAQIFPSKKERKELPDNTHFLIELSK